MYIYTYTPCPITIGPPIIIYYNLSNRHQSFVKFGQPKPGPISGPCSKFHANRIIIDKVTAISARQGVI